MIRRLQVIQTMRRKNLLLLAPLACLFGWSITSPVHASTAAEFDEPNVVKVNGLDLDGMIRKAELEKVKRFPSRPNQSAGNVIVASSTQTSKALETKAAGTIAQQQSTTTTSPLTKVESIPALKMTPAVPATEVTTTSRAPLATVRAMPLLRATVVRPVSWTDAAVRASRNSARAANSRAVTSAPSSQKPNNPPTSAPAANQSAKPAIDVVRINAPSAKTQLASAPTNTRVTPTVNSSAAPAKEVVATKLVNATRPATDTSDRAAAKPVSQGGADKNTTPPARGVENKPADAKITLPKYALLIGKILTASSEPIANGVILVSNGKIEAIGTRDQVKIPDGYTILDHSTRFAMPGIVDCHSHVGGTFDINEMVYQTNPELRVLDQIIPNNDRLKVGIAGGVTTIAFIPGSGTNMGGWGAILKTSPGTINDVLVRFPGALKIAQAGNPERRNGEFGSGHMGMNWVIREQLRAGQSYVKEWDEYEAGKRSEKPSIDLRLEYFKPLFRRQIPVLVHTQGYSVVMNTLRILHDEMNLKVVIDHGEFDSHELADEIKKREIVTIIGPRGFRYNRNIGQLRGIVDLFARSGVEMLGVNTDAPVVPQEELPFQATMAVRYGWDEAAAIRGLTIVPAKALMLDKRLGSLEVGKDADIVVSTGPIIDPKHYVLQVLVDGKIAYDVKRDRRRF